MCGGRAMRDWISGVPLAEALATKKMLFAGRVDNKQFKGRP